MGGRDQYSMDDLVSKVKGQGEFASTTSIQRGLIVSRKGVAGYVVVTVLIAVAVGLSVHYSTSCSKTCDCAGPETERQTPTDTPETSDEELWERCLNLSLTRQECLPGAIPCSNSYYDDNFLPKHFKPYHYTVEIQPDIYQNSPLDFSYQGNATIFLECVETSDVITVHTRQMIIDEVEVTRHSNGTTVGIRRTTTDDTMNTEFYTIYLDQTIAPGEFVSVSFSYSGTLSQDGFGMYYSDYEIANQTKYLMVTQFEATSARKAFPCMDEPALKATFEITLWRKATHTALTNMPRVSSEEKADGWIADYFGNTSVVMPTYLVAFAVAEYQFIDGWANNSLTNKHLRHWSRPDFIQQGFIDYSLEVCLVMFDYFEDYFNFAYEMPKEDQISIPDFDSGAMENWGLITYRESRMVLDPKHSTHYEKQRMTGTLAHELLHQWLGNVVTCEWWSDLWLQEGMARYHQHMAIEAAQPSWDIAQLFAGQVSYRALVSDQTGMTYPIHTPVYYNHQIETMFSSITYEKAACVIRMVHQLMLGDSYQPAMQEYIRRRAYKSANFSDLLTTWDDQVKKDNISLETNVTSVALTWLLQMGYPVITLSVQNRTSLNIKQERFLENPKGGIYAFIDQSVFNYTWEVPVTYVTKNNATNMQIAWLHKEGNKTVDIETSLDSDDDWLLGNYKQYGFYRVNYDLQNWAALIRQLNADHLVFDVVNRGQLLHDGYYFSRSGRLSLKTHLQATQYLSRETDYLPWHVAAEISFVHFSRIFRSHPGFLDFKKYVRSLVQPIYDRLGWEEKPNDTHHDIYLRDIVLTQSCMYGNPDCIARAKTLFAMWKGNETKTVRPDIRDAVYCTAIHWGLREDWEFLFNQYSTISHFSMEKSRRRSALTCSRDRSTLATLFHMAVTRNISHDTDGAIYILRDIARNPMGHYVAWEYLNNNWDSMPLVNKIPVLALLCDSFSTEFDLKKVESFIEFSYLTDSMLVDSPEFLNTIRQNIRWREGNEKDVFDWLHSVT